MPVSRLVFGDPYASGHLPVSAFCELGAIPDDVLLEGALIGLFVSESHDGIDTHSFPGRYVRREQSDGQEHERDAGE